MDRRLLVLVPRLSKALKYMVYYKLHLLFLLFCLLFILWGPSLSYGLRMIAKLSAPLLFMWLVMAAVSSSRQLEWTERTILASGVATVLLALAARVFGLSFDPRFTLPFTSPAPFSAHIAAVSMLATAGFAIADKGFDLATLLWTPILMKRPFELQSHRVASS